MNLLISVVPLRCTVVISSLMLIDGPQAGAAEFNGDGLASVAEAGLDALARDLDAAAAGYPPLDCQAGLRERVWPGEADALETVPLAGRRRHPVPGS